MAVSLHIRLALFCVVSAALQCRPRETPRTTDAGATSTTPKASLAPVAKPSPLPPGFLRGQLHTHTSRSADSNTDPHAVHRWYEERGYDFVVFTDHNAVTDTADTAMLTIPGAELTYNVEDCDPPPEPGKVCAMHMNVLFASTDAGGIDLGDGSLRSRREIYRRELKQAEALGGVAMLNHPNMASGADEALLFDLSQRGLVLFEIGNQSWDSDNAGDAKHPSTEALWDAVLTRGARVFGTVTDDAHFYGDLAAARARGERPFPGGLGFVVVRAEKAAASIRDAIVHGHFYGSTGVLFSTYDLGPKAIALATLDGSSVLFEVIGRGGVLLRRERGPRLDMTLGDADRPYVRVRATRDDGAGAWTQPIFRVSP